jgi:hypothetical protein
MPKPIRASATRAPVAGSGTVADEVWTTANVVGTVKSSAKLPLLRRGF